MPTLALQWDNTRGAADLILQPASLGTGDALSAAVLVSIFSDRRARADDPVDDADLRGWWGDSYATRPIGSRMWLLLRAKRTTETLRRAKDYLLEALQWVVDDGIAARLEVETEWTQPRLLGARITLYQRDGTRRALSYEWAWEA